MGSFSGKSEIVEEKDDQQSSAVYSKRTILPHSRLSIADGKDLECPVLKLGYKGSLEEDINQLFKSISIRSSGMIPSYKVGVSMSRNTSLLGKNTLKKPVNPERSAMATTAESASLKQALRDHCIYKASETAAMKRVTKSSGLPGCSGVGRLKNLYDSVSVELGSAVSVANGEGKVVLVELLGESRNSSQESIAQQLHALKIKSSSEFSAQVSPNFASSSRSGNETGFGLKSVRRVRLLYDNALTSTNANGQRRAKVSRTVPTTKLAIPNKVSVKKNSKQCTSPENVYDEVDGFYNPITKQLLCHRCHSALKNAATREACENSFIPSTENTDYSFEVGSDDHSVEETSQGFCSSGYEDFNGINTDSKSNQDAARDDVKADLITSSTETNQISLTSPFVNSDAEVDLIGFKDDPKNPNKVDEVCQKDSLLMSGHNAEMSSFNERSVAVNSGSPPDKPNIDGTINEEDNTNNMRRGDNREFSQSSVDIIGGNSTSSSISEAEESNESISSFGNRPHMLKDMRWEAIQHIKTNHGSIGLKHFNLLKKLGGGDIGTVYLAELIGTNCLFAIKVMDNEFLARRNKMPRAQTEREILKMLDHPFLPTLYSHFTSNNLACLVMECCPGGDLHVIRQKQPRRCFSEPAARFYVAEVLLALEYLHMLGVIYRDLKPENILVREDGHIMVTDFDLSLRCTVSPTLLCSSSPLHREAIRHSGQATQSSCIEPWCIQPSCFHPRLLDSTKKGRRKRIRELKKSNLIARFRSLPQLVAEPTDARSNSFVGTHEYLAPEIIKGQGHGAAVDWWTFGIFLYELLYGRTPFKGSTNEETLANVVLQNLKFPDNPNVSFRARDLIRGLLVKEPKNRLGTEKGAAEIKCHPFFEGLNWALIRCAIPPELPESYEYGASSHDDKGNYLECKAIGQHLEFELF